MPSTVIVNNRTVVHASSTGQAIAAAPDFCKTPTPGGPVPMPYPNIAMSSTTSSGSTTVKMDGNPIMLKDSEFSTSTGDEGGTAGGGVVSNVIKGKAKFTVYSFDVKADGKNVPRLGDAMTNNGNGPNTMTPAECQAPAVALGMTVAEFKLICGAFCDVQNDYKNGKISGRGCCSKAFEQKIKDQISAGNLPADTLSEASFLLPSSALGAVTTGIATTGAVLITGAVYTALQGAGLTNVYPWAAKFVGGVTAATPIVSAPVANTVARLAGRVCRPDLVLQTPPPRRCFDAKFKWKKGADKWKKGQRRDQRRVDGKGKPKQLNPKSCCC